MTVAWANSKPAALFALFSAIACLPMFVMDTGGDRMLHYIMMRCFSMQFWQGDLYPRWCFYANTEMGSPLFMFYFPLPYWIAALFSPLEGIGINVYRQVDAQMFLALFISAWTSFIWLRGIAGERCALAGSALYVLMPYHMELLFSRAAVAEMWMAAFLPLVLHALRYAVRGEQDYLPMLAGSYALCLLSHIPGTSALTIAMALYIFIMRPRAWQLYASLLGAGVLAIGIAAIYVLPAQYYGQFLQPSDLYGPDRPGDYYGWPNRQLRLSDFLSAILAPALTSVLTMLAFAFLIIRTLCKQARIADGFVRREAVAWSVIIVTAMVLFLPVSAPMWKLLTVARELIFPWRMQVLFLPGMAFFAVVTLRWLMRNKPKTGDGIALLMLLVMGTFFLTSAYKPGQEEEMNWYLRAMPTDMFAEYRTIWQTIYQKDDEFMARWSKTDEQERFRLLQGSADIAVRAFQPGRLALRIDARENSRIRLYHFYFPAWKMIQYAGSGITFGPEPQTGNMQLEVPRGVHEVEIRLAPYTGAWQVKVAPYISFFACAFIFAWSVRARRNGANWQHAVS